MENLDDFAADVTTTGVLTADGTIAVGNIDIPDDDDWFALDVVAGERYVIDLTGITIDTFFLDINLIDASGDFVTSARGRHQLTFVAQETETVFIEVNAVINRGSGTEIGQYNLTANIVEDDFADDATTTGVLTADGTAIIGSLDFPDDDDWFALDVVVGQVYIIDLTGVTTTEFGFDLNLVDSNGVILSGIQGNESLVFTASETGTVFIEVNGDQFSLTGEYNLTANAFEDDFTADVTTTGVLTAGGAAVTGNIDYVNDEDWFALEVTQGEAYNISFASSLSGANLDVYDNNGVILLEGSDTVSFTAQTTETVYISASGSSRAAGNYELEASVIAEAPDLPSLFDDFAGDASTTGVVHVEIIDGFGGDFLRGSLETAGDDDWFAINVQSAVSVDFSDFSDISENLDNLTLSIFDSNGALVTSGSGGTGLSFDFVETGTYFLSVTATDGVLTTDYEIDAFSTPVTQAPEPIPAPEPEPIPEPTPELPVGPNFLVTNTNDFGEGSLRQAILDSNEVGGNNTIDFASSLLGQTIEVFSTLPINTNAVINGDDITISAAGNNQLFRLDTDGVTFENNLATINFGLDSTSEFNSSAVVVVANDASFINNGIINTVDTSIFVGGSNFTLTNSVDGEISGGSEAVSALSLLFSNPDNDGFTTINNAGLLEGNEYGIFATTAQVTNSGTIQSLGVQTDDVNSGSFNSAGVLLLGSLFESLTDSDNLITNTATGLIQGGEVGIGLASGGTINNAGNVVAELNTVLLFGSLAGPDAPADYIINNSGTLARTGTDSGTIFIQATIGVDFNVTSAVITNSGIIQSTDIAIAALSGTTLNNQASGAIQSDLDGIGTSGDGEDGIAFFATTQSELERVDENGELVFNDIEGVDFGDTINNQGTIIGNIVTGLGDDSVANTGVIDGDISLGAGNDIFISTGTNNGLGLIIDGGEGDDVINGGEGLETVVYADARSRYSITETDGVITVTDTFTDEGLDEGTDTLTDVEFIQFSDGTFAVDSLINDLAENSGNGVTITNQSQIIGDISFTGPGDDSIINNGIIDGDISLGAGDDTFISTGTNGGLGLTINGGEGNDTIDGGDGAVTAVLNGSFSDYNISENEGVVTITDVVGSDGTDTLENIDRLSFEDGDVELRVGTSDDDALAATTGVDLILLGTGDDSVNASNGADFIYGDEGDDIIIGGNGADFIDGGDGIDQARYANSNGAVIVDLGSGSALGGHAEGDTLVDIENLFGSNHDDTLTGDDGDNVLSGSNGDDTLTGAGGTNDLIGGNGDDTFIGGAGADFNNGGGGFGDTIDYSGSFAAVEARLGGNQVFDGGFATGDDFQGIEDLIGSAFDDALVGNVRANVLTGNAGDDFINGDRGTDTLLGGDGDDTLIGGFGQDTIDGGDGIDTARYANANSRAVVNLETGEGSAGHSFGDTLINIENLFGSVHNDVFIGDSGANQLSGFDGVDRLTGGEGNDVLVGGNGNDRFIFTDNWDNDTITDFEDGGDLLDFRTVTGVDALSDLMVANNASGDAVVSFGGDSVTLLGIDAADIDAGDFLF